MKLPIIVRRLLKLPLKLLLRVGFFRRRLAFEMRYHWYHDLEIAIPLSHGLICPIFAVDSVYSFSEIFVNTEYDFVNHSDTLPKRWIDVGCHAGYFTLYLAWQRAIRGENHGAGLLIDADPRTKERVLQTLAMNRLEDNFSYLHGLISSAPGGKDFALRAATASSVDLDRTGVQHLKRIHTISPDAILTAFAPPYDLIKMDIEGGEYDFIESYEPVYRHAAEILVEWHSSDQEGEGEKRVLSLLGARGFRHVKTAQPARTLRLGDRWLSCGVHLYQRI